MGQVYAEAVGNNATGKPPVQQSQPKPKPDAFPAIPITVQNDVHNIARALEDASKKQPSRQEQDSAATYLQTQEDLATWAGRMFWVGLAEILVTAAGVFLVWRTLKATWAAKNEAKRAADAAGDTVTKAKETMEQAERHARQELRGYLSVEPIGIRQLSDSNDCIGQVSVKNVGKVPAKCVAVFVNMRLSGQRDTEFNVQRDPDDVLRTIQPGAFMTQGSENYLPISEVVKAGKYVYVFGAVYYEDGFGEDRRYTRFCHRYATASFDRRAWMDAENLTKRIVIDASKARYHTHCNEAT
jgi:hypothetical protein